MKFILIIIFSFILSIILFEFFLKLSPFSFGVTPMVYDKDIGMWHKKNYSNYLISDCYKNKYFFDSSGRVKNNYKYDDTKKDIIIIGDSKIEGLQVENQSVVHNALYREIQGQYNVLNYGLAGTGPAQHLEILKNKVDLTNTKTLLHFVFLENDLNDSDPNNLDGVNRPKVYLDFKDNMTFDVIKPKKYDFKEKLRDFIGNFEIYVYLKKTFYYYKTIFFDTRQAETSNKDRKMHYTISNEKFKFKQLQGAIYQINKLALDYDFSYHIFFFSSFEKKGFNDYKNKLISFLSDININNINILPYLNDLEKKHALDFSCDPHWNKKTHQDLAKYLNKLIDF